MSLAKLNMAINSIDIPCNKTRALSQSSLNHYKQGELPASAFTLFIGKNDSTCNNLSDSPGKFKKSSDYKSPYFKGDNIQLLSRVTEKKMYHNENSRRNNMRSPINTDRNVYKVNSDDFKPSKTLKANGKKVLKSVLTLPNDSTPPQLYTLSDINDSEYCNEKDDTRKKTKKRYPPNLLRKYQPRTKYYDRDEQHCADMDIHLDSSSETIRKCGDSRRTRKILNEPKGKAKENTAPHDVWAVLRNINRFQFRPTPQISEESLHDAKKKNLKRRNNRKDFRVFETRRTEEFAYISSYDVEKSPGYSRCSSFDKITVIDKKQDFKAKNENNNLMQKKKKLGKQSCLSSINKCPPEKHNKIKALTVIGHEMVDKTKDDKSIVTCLVHENLARMIDNNASVDLGYESRTTETEEDHTTFGRDIIPQKCQNIEMVYSDNSGSSKAAFLKQTTLKKGKSGRPQLCLDKQMNGITKVILSRGQNVNHVNKQDKVEIPKKIIRDSLAVVAGKRVITPKLTKTEINRQLNKYRFPVLVLGKDQLRPSTHVLNIEHPQFDGLDEQIWPFMKSWYGIERSPRVKKPSNLLNKKSKLEEINKKTIIRYNHTLNQIKQKEHTHIQKQNKTCKTEQKRAPITVLKIIDNVTQDKKKHKPVTQLKDRMLKLLYKNVSAVSVIDEPQGTRNVKENPVMKIDTCTNTQDDAESIFINDNNETVFHGNNTCSTVCCALKVTKAPAQFTVGKRSWAKAKWTSDFIDNIIRKIKSGVYYNQDNNINIQERDIDLMETEIQTDFVEETTQEIAIPGFNNTLPEIEIKTMNVNEVLVKHCLRNITVRFDVTVPTKRMINVQSTSAVVPTKNTDNISDVFKCPTSILNANLPAELCIMLPKMLHNIMDYVENAALFSVPNNTISCFSSKTEEPPRCDNTTNFASIPAILPFRPMLQELIQLLNGRFSVKHNNISPSFHVVRNTSIFYKDERELCKELKPDLSRAGLFGYDSKFVRSLVIKEKDQDKLPALPSLAVNETQQINKCTALQPYPASDRNLLTISKYFNLTNLFEKMAPYINNMQFSCFGVLNSINDNNLGLQLKINKLQNIPYVETLKPLDLITVYPTSDLSSVDQVVNLSVTINTSQTLSTECLKKYQINCNTEEDPFKSSWTTNNNRIRGKAFGKLYRKCKSASYISREKAIPLSRITNLDEFILALGSAKLLADVFDGQSGRKLMTAVEEMKNWATEINPRQALLLLLLSNKKDTPNLIRYRPMLIQGIAVKRITKAHELDMEIEVIERENVKGTCQYEGISYLLATAENQDSLYEELCWIAKNTASDYQKSYDQTSEKLLKSLLEKRKKLNPSYLRVMARYVGLGLLKPPGRKQTF